MPARLYYDLSRAPDVTRALDSLRCCDRTPGGDNWDWLYDDEAIGLSFQISRSDLPPEVNPIVIGRLQLTPDGRLTITVRSCERAAEAARFFDPILGTAATLRRMRIVNRFFEASEVERGLDALDALLDRDVTVVDPREAEEAMENVLRAAPPDPAAKLAALDHHLRQRNRDIPMVEDFPLWPEEEDERFTQLATTIQFRYIRAFEHWNGNHLTLAEVIRKVVTGEGGLYVKAPQASR